MEYTQEMKADIIERTQKALEAVKGFDLEIQAQVIATDTGNDVFGLKVIPFLKDLKYVETTEEPKIIDVEASEATVSPFVSQPSTDENNTATA